MISMCGVHIILYYPGLVVTCTHVKSAQDYKITIYSKPGTIRPFQYFPSVPVLHYR
jgi:hypothetical protein